MALTLEDVLMRRLHVHLRTRAERREVAREVARLMAARLGWDEARIEAEVRRYEDVVARESCARSAPAAAPETRAQTHASSAQVPASNGLSNAFTEKLR
jgi:glycerol-3-phosphate dehydrogenase